jgi:putative SOS response-associated peptidase YedK
MKIVRARCAFGYTLRLSAWEVRNLIRHRNLIGKEFADVMGSRNDAMHIYPNYEAPVAVVRDGQRLIENMLWGFPPPPNVTAKRYVTTVRNTSIKYWRRWLEAPNVQVGNDAGGRCIVPATSFAEPDKMTGKDFGTKSVNRWFALADGTPFFFAGIWREWEGDRGTKAKPNVGRHELYSILTTEPNGVVQPVHEKAMPVILRTPEEVELWLTGSLEEILRLQKPANDDARADAPANRGRLIRPRISAPCLRFRPRSGRQYRSGMRPSP